VHGWQLAAGVRWWGAGQGRSSEVAASEWEARWRSNRLGGSQWTNAESAVRLVECMKLMPFLLCQG
jgi:hypothetical protein